MYDKVDSDDIYFASGITSVNDFRSALAGLRLDEETSRELTASLEDLEKEHSGKSLYMQIDDIRRNLPGILELLMKLKGQPTEEAVKG